MIITRLETYTRGHLSVVRALTDDGLEGFGQMSPFNADISAAVFHRQVAPLALRVAQWAEKAGFICVPHSANDSLVLTFTLHLMGALPNAGPHVEYSIEPSICPEGLYTPAPVVQNGMVSIPSGPGWGVTLNPDWLAAAECRTSE